MLKCGDVIWLHHSESISVLAAARNAKGVDKYNFSSLNLEKWLSKDNLDLTVLHSKRNDDFGEYSGNTFALWVIESKDHSGGVV